MAEHTIAERVETVCYRVRDVLYVPHYKTPKAYVGPGYIGKRDQFTLTKEQLHEMGGVPEPHFLWPRI